MRPHVLLSPSLAWCGCRQDRRFPRVPPTGCAAGTATSRQQEGKRIFNTEFLTHGPGRKREALRSDQLHLSQGVCLPLIQDEPEGSKQACLRDWVRAPRYCDYGDQADTAAGCLPAEPLRQEEEEESAALLPFVIYSASYIR